MIKLTIMQFDKKFLHFAFKPINVVVTSILRNTEETP